MKRNDLRILLSAFLLVVINAACVDDHDSPPSDVPFITGEGVTIEKVKLLYSAELAKPWQNRVPVRVENDWTIKGIITASDKKDGNLYKEAFIQDTSSGLRMLFDATSGLYIGDSVVVNVKGLYLGDYGNFIQMGSEPYTDDSGNKRVSGFNMDNHILRVSMGNPTIVVSSTIKQVKSSTLQGKLVKLENVQFDDNETGKSWADALADPPASANRLLTDCSGATIIVRTSGYASFAADLLPAGKGTITGIVTVFNSDYQLLVRDYSEVLLTGERCGYVPQPLGTPVETLSQTFTGFANDATIYLQGWQNLAQFGGRLWLAKLFSGNTYAQSTGYNSGLTKMVTWLITPPVNLSSPKVLTFQTAKAYWAHIGNNLPMEVLFSTDYTGNNLTTATWSVLSAIKAGKNDPDHTFISSGEVALPVQPGKSGVIAFKYSGSSTESTTFRIDNIEVKMKP